METHFGGVKRNDLSRYGTTTAHKAKRQKDGGRNTSGTVAVLLCKASFFSSAIRNVSLFMLVLITAVTLIMEEYPSTRKGDSHLLVFR